MVKVKSKISVLGMRRDPRAPIRQCPRPRLPCPRAGGVKPPVREKDVLPADYVASGRWMRNLQRRNLSSPELLDQIVEDFRNDEILRFTVALSVHRAHMSGLTTMLDEKWSIPISLALSLTAGLFDEYVATVHTHAR